MCLKFIKFQRTERQENCKHVYLIGFSYPVGFVMDKALWKVNGKILMVENLYTCRNLLTGNAICQTLRLSTTCTCEYDTQPDINVLWHVIRIMFTNWNTLYRCNSNVFELSIPWLTCGKCTHVDPRAAHSTDVAGLNHPRIYRFSQWRQQKLNEMNASSIRWSDKRKTITRVSVILRGGSGQIIIGSGDRKWSGSWLDFTCRGVFNHPRSEAWRVFVHF